MVSDDELIADWKRGFTVMCGDKREPRDCSLLLLVHSQLVY